MKLSIITINKNNADGLRKTIESVVTQTFNAFEFIIIDGGSTDGSKAIIEYYSYKLSYWVSEPDKGIYYAMNKGIQRSNGDYCLFLNSGDFLVDKNVLNNVFANGYTEDILYGNCNVSKDGRIVFTAIPSEDITLETFYNKSIPHQSVFIKKELFEQYGYYSEKNKILSDYEFWICAIIQGNCTTKHIDLVISDYNLEGISSDSDNIVILPKDMRAILDKYLPSRVLEDYEAWHLEREDNTILYWVKSEPILYKSLCFFYTLVSLFISAKNKFARVFKN